MIEKNKVKRILLIKLRGIGDVILSTVVFNNLRKDFPGAKIDYLTEAPSKAALELLPFINEILLFDKNKPNPVSLIRQIRKNRYDLIFDFYSNPRTALLTFLSGAAYRAGFPYRGRNYAFNLKGPEERDKFHAAELHLEFLKKLGLSHNENEMFFSLSDEDIKFSDDFFNEKFNPGELVFGMSPSGGWPSKKCDPVKFAEIGEAIIKEFSGKILLLWGPGDHAEAIEIRKLMNHRVTLAPLTDIRKMGALIKNCTVLVANDSGPMHISTAVKTPTLSLHGPTNPRLQGPYGSRHEWLRLEDLDCIECNLLDCPRKHECFMDLPVDAVIDRIRLLITKNNIPLPVNEKD